MPVSGVELLSAGRALSWSEDRTVRMWRLGEEQPLLASYFDARPTAILCCAGDRFLVGDALGRVHVLTHLD
jgi:hypothetical protein